MKLVTYYQAGTSRLGAVMGDVVIDLAGAQAARQGEDFPADMLTFLQAGDEARQTAGEIIEWVESNRKSAEEPFVHALSDLTLAPPILNPSKIICVGLNYADHCREQNIDLPKSPVLFAKFPTALIGINEAITWPAESSQQVDYEAELAVVIGREAKNVSEDEAYRYVAGCTIVNDVSARDVQFSDGQWIRGKSFDTFCPMGPYLVTMDEIDDPQELDIRCRVNGELRQDSNTREMIFQIPFLISFISKTSTLLPGDVISTGTPAGVGVFRNPKVFLKPGDVVEVEIETLGLLRNSVIGG